jgi:hypothetical protein
MFIKKSSDNRKYSNTELNSKKDDESINEDEKQFLHPFLRNVEKEVNRVNVFKNI